MERMKHEHEKVIERPLHAVAAMYADRARITEWHPSVGDYRHLSGEPGRAGAKAELVFKGFTIVETVKDRNLPDSFSHIDEPKDWNCHVTFENAFEELSPSSTKWTVTAEFILTGNWMEREIMKRVMSEEKIEKEICEYMKAFKEFAEAEL